MTRKIIIDCDPGQDDAVALFLAMASPDELDLLGITAVGGNVPLELTHHNARQMCDIAGRQDIPVYAGCAEPMIRPPMTAEMIHGDSGINGIDVFEPETPLQSEHAVAPKSSRPVVFLAWSSSSTSRAANPARGRLSQPRARCSEL